MNPILPENCFVPDGEAHVMPDGRLYIYGSWDLTNNPTRYCSKELHCFSTDDMENWTDHGLIFRNDSVWNGIPWVPDALLFAPDAIHKDGKYYLYLCGDSEKYIYEGVAVAPTPVGPFSKAEKIEIADNDSIDPAIFVDDDGQAYYFWGQFNLRGGKLEDDMKTLIPETVRTNILTEHEHGFHEGSSLRKRNGKYYLVYADLSRGKATCLSYAMSDNPLGPYKKCGTIIDNIYCDPQTWNNHGSIECFNGKWYVFYHRSSQNAKSSRRACVEEIHFDENGLIKEVEQTSSGATGPIDAFSEIRAYRACRLFQKAYITPKDGRDVLTNCGKMHWDTYDWAEYKYLDFGDGRATKANFKVRGKGKITVKIEDDFNLGSVEFSTDEFTWVSFPVEHVEGVHAMWLALEEEEFDIDSFYFE